MMTQFELKSEVKIYGNWQYEKVIIEGKEFNASSLNECGYKDILEIRRNSEIEEYEFDGQEIKGNKIGFSNSKICSISPIVYKYVIVNNSCKTHWIRLANNPKRIVSINEGVVIEYEIEKQNRKKMTLSKIKEITNYGSQQPDKIELKRIKKEN